MRRIASIWLPQWPIERLMRHDPACVPDEVPFALVLAGAHGIRIHALNSAALREGVRPGMSLADARASLPALQSQPADLLQDARALRRLARWLGRYGPLRNTEESDGVWIDITGVAHLFGGEPALLNDLVRRLRAFGLTARAGLADTPGAAHALARFASPPHALAAPGQTHAALAPLPVDALRLSPEACLLLKRLGLRRIGQLTELPRSALERRFSTELSARTKGTRPAAMADAVLARLDQALGLTPEPRRALGEPPVLSVRRSWGEPLISSDILLHEVETLAADLARTLAAAGLGARRIALWLYRADGSVAHTAAGLSQPSIEPQHFMRLMAEKLSSVDAGFGIDAAVFDAVLVERIGARQESLGRETAGDGAAALIDRLVNRLGPGHLYALRPCASHIPERATARVPPLEHARSDVSIPPPPFASARPILLFTPPEPVTVMAEVPDGPPRHFTWRRVRHGVAKAEGPERIAPAWWQHIGETVDGRAVGPVAEEDAGDPDDGLGHRVRPPSRNRTRDYYVVETHGGARFWMFREGLYSDLEDAGPPLWFMHGLFG